MRAYNWEKKYEVGFKPIDNQHKFILYLINRLLANKKRGEKNLILLLEELLCYTRYHFKSEENYMVIYRYREYESHKIEHGILLKELNEKIEVFKKGEISIEKLAESLIRWAVPHIIEVDKIVGKYLSRLKSD